MPARQPAYRLIAAGADLAALAMRQQIREANSMAEVIIRHPRTQHEVGIELRDFRHRKLAQDKDGNEVSYQDAGYRIVSYMDGSPYEQPAPKSDS